MTRKRFGSELSAGQLGQVRGGSVLHALAEVAGGMFDIGVSARHNKEHERGVAANLQKVGGLASIVNGGSHAVVAGGIAPASATGHALGALMGLAGGVSAGIGIDDMVSTLSGGHTVSGALASAGNGVGAAAGGAWNGLNNLWDGKDVDWDHAGDEVNEDLAPMGGILPAVMGVGGGLAGLMNPVLGGAIGLSGTLLEGLGMATHDSEVGAMGGLMGGGLATGALIGGALGGPAGAAIGAMGGTAVGGLLTLGSMLKSWSDHDAGETAPAGGGH